MVHPDVELLRKRADELLSRLFQRKPLVRAKWSNDVSGFKQQFDQAGTLYRVGAFGEARQIFLEVAAASPDRNGGVGLIATFNAAACAVAADDYRGVIDLLEPHRGIVKGHPLWNLALSHYKLGEISQAVAALRAWTLRALPDEKGRGALVAACVACKSGDVDTTGHLLTEAKIANENFVPDELGLSKKQQPKLTEAAKLQPRQSLSEVKRNRVLQLLPPKKPERRPELAVTLSASEVESFSTAVEAIAEGKSPQALKILRGLEQKYPDQHHLHIALAAAELFAGNAVAAQEILQRLKVGGVKLSGSAYWNLARAELILGNQPGALQALEACSKTEYLTNSAVWRAISELAEEERSPPPRAPGTSPPQMPAAKSGIREPSLFDIRRTSLEALIKPRLMPAKGKLDLVGLLQRDQIAIEQILKDARTLDPSEAYILLQPWIAKYPKLYILKSHAAGIALLAGLTAEAQALLETAAEIRPLEKVSRWNLAHIYLQKNEFRKIDPLLDGARSSALAETSNYWLAVAIVRTLSQYGDAADVAARALLHASEPQKPALLETLQKCRIAPSEGPVSPEEAPVDLTVSCAREALALLDQDKIDAASARLITLCGHDLDEVPEIGRKILQPAFHHRSRRRLSQRVYKAFNEECGIIKEARMDKRRNNSRISIMLAARKYLR